MVNGVLILLVAVFAVFAGVLILGAYRWDSRTRALRARLEAAGLPVEPKTIDFRDLDGLPSPVRRFFRTALTDGQPIVAGVHMQHCGTFNLGESTDRWVPFTSEQKVVARRPGFAWDGRITLCPGLSVRVHDAYLAGEGLFHAALLGLVSLGDVRGAGAVAEGELMRFLAEAAWFPTVLLPSQGITWQPVDDRSALATLTEGPMAATLLFAFDASGLIETVRAESRVRMVGGDLVPTPWQGRFWNYGERDGMRVPIDGEAAWLLPAGTKPYWRGRITHIAYEFAP